jgi:hypothetical protein
MQDRHPSILLGDVGRIRLELHVAGVDESQRLGRGRARLRHRVGNIAGTLAGAGDEDPIGERVHRSRFGWCSEEEEALG